MPGDQAIAGLRSRSSLGRATWFFVASIPPLGVLVQLLEKSMRPFTLIGLLIPAAGVLWMWREAFWLAYGALFRRHTALRVERGRLVFIHALYSSRLLHEITSAALPAGSDTIEVETAPHRRQMHIPTRMLRRAKTTVHREVRAAIRAARGSKPG